MSKVYSQLRCEPLNRSVVPSSQLVFGTSTLYLGPGLILLGLVIMAVLLPGLVPVGAKAVKGTLRTRYGTLNGLVLSVAYIQDRLTSSRNSHCHCYRLVHSAARNPSSHLTLATRVNELCLKVGYERMK